MDDKFLQRAAQVLAHRCGVLGDPVSAAHHFVLRATLQVEARDGFVFELESEKVV